MAALPTQDSQESAELDYEERGIAVRYSGLSIFVMLGVNLRDSVR